jgi:ABC-2 type transport system ATP-binding protein
VLIGGHDIERESVEAKRRIAFVGDEPHLFEHLTLMEHLRLTARMYGVGDVEVPAAEWLKELELTGRETALPSELTRGMKQKVALACALIHDPQALVLDEPLTGLDPSGFTA